MKKILKLMAIPAAILALASCSGGVVGSSSASVPQSTPSTSASSQPAATTTKKSGIPDGVEITTNYSKTILDYTSYENTSSYKRVTTPKEFLDALYEARFDYTNSITREVPTDDDDGYMIRANVRKNATNWNNALTKGLYLKNEDGTYTKIPSDVQFDPNDEKYTASMTYYEDSPCARVSIEQNVSRESNVRVIEIANNLDLGYNLIKNLGANEAVYENWDKNQRLEGATDIYADPDIKAAGISKIKVSRASNLVIYSKNGAKLTHCGFEVSSCYNVSFRNLEMDEIWMWEDSTAAMPTITVGNYDAFGWAYFKVSYSEGVWIDHCTFGKSFDGQIDYSNPYYTSKGTYERAPIGASGNNGLNVTFCDFKAGSDDRNGYIYKMMNTIEQEYQKYVSEGSSYQYTNKSCRYYFALRDLGLTFDEVFYGIAIPQKKAFLWGDSGDDYRYNKNLQATLSSCTLKNIEDRIPKVRGGIAYVYNTLVDNTEYFDYIPALSGVQNALKAMAPKDSKNNPLYKLGAVSQGIIASLDASVYLESVEYRGISSYLKNNEESIPDNKNYPTINGGYMIKNSILGNKQGSSDSNNPFNSLNTSKNKLSTDEFAIKIKGEKTTSTTIPFTINAYDLLENGSLDDYFLANKAGTITNKDSNYWLKAYIA